MSDPTFLPAGVVPSGKGYAAVIHQGRHRTYLAYTSDKDDAAAIYQAVKLLLKVGYLQPDTLPPPVKLRERAPSIAARAKRLGLHPNTIYLRARRSGMPPAQVLLELELEQEANTEANTELESPQKRLPDDHTLA